MGVAYEIKKRRLELGLSQQDLADAIGYRSRSTIAKIESGENDVPLAKLERFAGILNTTVEGLLGGFSSSVALNLTEDGVEGDAGREEALPCDKRVAVVLAGGRSSRNLQDVPNQFINVLGKPVIVYCLEVYQKHPMIDAIYAVCLKEWEGVLEAYAAQHGISKLAGIVPAGDSGVRSAKNAVAHLGDVCGANDVVVLQESTRPLVSEETVSKLLLAGANGGSVVACEPMSDRIQFYCSEGRASYVERDRLVSMQSPEVHRLSTLQEAFRKAEESSELLDGTCCALMMHQLGFELSFCRGNCNNIKIVRQEDIAVFAALLSQAMQYRQGQELFYSTESSPK